MGVMLAIFSLVYPFLYTSLKNPCAGSLQNHYHTGRFAPYVPLVVHRVANLRRSIRVYQTLGFHVLKGSSLRRAFDALWLLGYLAR